MGVKREEGGRAVGGERERERGRGSHFLKATTAV